MKDGGHVTRKLAYPATICNRAGRRCGLFLEHSACASTSQGRDQLRLRGAANARFQPTLNVSLKRGMPGSMNAAETQLESFIDKFDAENQALIRGIRAALRSRLPDCAELVYDNYNFLVIGYSPTERPSDYLVSIAAAAAGVSLSFNRGAELADPDQILMGSGKVNRFVRLSSPDMVSIPVVDRMIESACALSHVPQPWICRGKLIIRSISSKQRPRRRLQA